MTKLPQTLKHWNSGLFSQTLKNEITSIAVDTIPLQKATTQGGIVSDRNIEITILRKSETPNTLIIYTGLFFTEIVPSCSCGDEPMEVNNYCEMEMTINKSNAKTTFRLINDAN